VEEIVTLNWQVAQSRFAHVSAGGWGRKVEFFPAKALSLDRRWRNGSNRRA